MSKKFKKLVKIVGKLRGPSGCPWDREQTHQSLKPHLIEEAYEVIEAIDEKNYKKFCEELGDLLLQIVLHSQLAKEKRKFDINQVIDSISEKLIHRHPHVFSKKKLKSVKEVLAHWEEIKGAEDKSEKSILAGIPQAMPALYKAEKVQTKAARVGFDWNKIAGAWKKVHEELREINKIIRTGRRSRKKKGRLTEEIGDVLFAIVNVARKMNINAEEALQKSTAKFIRRFKNIENFARLKGKKVPEMTLAEMDKFWNIIKRTERASS